MSDAMRLPEDFFFGAAMSGPQTEGAYRSFGRIESVWDTWSDLDLGAFHNRVGSYGGNDLTGRFEQEFETFASLGLSSVRTSIQWTRLIDERGRLNEEGAAYYHHLFRAARDAGIEPYVNLYHFDMPTHLFRRGGWESREVIEAYANYARIALTEFGNEIEHWFTFNEPIVEPEQRYLEGRWYPFIHDFRRARTAQYHLSLAHALATHGFRELKEKGVVRKDALVGLICNFSPPYTRQDPSEADLEAVRMTDGINNRWWLDLACAGKLPHDVLATLAERDVVIPTRPGDKEALASGTVDWIGFNYYQPTRVQAPTEPADRYGNPLFAVPYRWEGAVMNESRGWEIYPKGIYDFAMKITRDYPDLTWFVSENGIGVEEDGADRDELGRIRDASWRVPFVRDHLKWIARAIEEGAHCLGYHYWGVIDCWSWNNAFKNRYGFVEVDLTHGYERRLKESASWLREVTRTHVLD